ncbi:MAG: YihA family ribosome biogenesis GTP-binding protein, partial [Pseudomonadota bacterium]
FQVVLTKVDKPKKGERDKVLASVGQVLSKHPAAYPELIITSSETGEGIPLLRAAVAALFDAG